LKVIHLGASLNLTIRKEDENVLVKQLLKQKFEHHSDEREKEKKEKGRQKEMEKKEKRKREKMRTDEKRENKRKKET
jgi:hypothetical protein